MYIILEQEANKDFEDIKQLRCENLFELLSLLLLMHNCLVFICKFKIII